MWLHCASSQADRLHTLPWMCALDMVSSRNTCRSRGHAIVACTSLAPLSPQAGTTCLTARCRRTASCPQGCLIQTAHHTHPLLLHPANRHDLFDCLLKELPLNNYTSPVATWLDAFPPQQLKLVQASRPGCRFRLGCRSAALGVCRRLRTPTTAAQAQHRGVATGFTSHTLRLSERTTVNPRCAAYEMEPE